MKKITSKALLLMMALAFTGLFITSCGDDDITGCTDTEAENYDSEATVSGDCTYAADKFFGDYLGSSDCVGSATQVINGLSNDTLMFAVLASITGGPNDALISIPIQGTPVSFAATVSGDELTVDALLGPLPFPNPLDPTMTVLIDIKADGVMTYDSSDNSASGDIALIITISGTTDVIDGGSCFITGIKQ